jgi:hypothetical protein
MMTNPFGLWGHGWVAFFMMKSVSKQGLKALLPKLAL